MATAAQRRELKKEAEKRAKQLGPLLAILLLFREGQGTRVRFDKSTMNFYYEGLPVKVSMIRAMLESMESQLAAVIIGYVAKLEASEWSTSLFQIKMEELLKESHLLFAALAWGGIAATIAAGSVMETVDQRSNRDIKYLKGLTRDVRRGKYRSNSQRLKGRAKAYLKSARITYQNIQLEGVKQFTDYTEARRIIRSKESCETTNGKVGCLQVAQASWIPIDKMPPIGTLVSGQFCLCYLQYR